MSHGASPGAASLVLSAPCPNKDRPFGCHGPLSDPSNVTAQPGLDRDSLRVITGPFSVLLLEQGEGRVVYVRNLSSDMSSRELKKRFEVFGEIVECQVLTRSKR